MRLVRFFNKRIALIAVALLSASWTHSQTCGPEKPEDSSRMIAEALARSETLAEALAASGFDRAIVAPGAPNAYRKLISPEFAISGETFVAAYYVADEVDYPLHVSLFENRGWIHTTVIPKDEDGDIGGAILNVQLTAKHIIIETHLNPSAGKGLVFERAGLKLLGVLSGFGFVPMPGSLIRFMGNMVHFAPTHQEQLMVFDPESGKTTEVFPGHRKSRFAERYRRAYGSVCQIARSHQGRVREVR